MEPIRVLVVDDDQSVRKVVDIRLRQLGFYVETAADGQEALHLIEIADWDVILLDLRMPGMDGFQFLELYDGKAPIVVMSGWSDMKDLPREPFARVMKPMSMDEVAPILRKAAAMAAL